MRTRRGSPACSRCRTTSCRRCSRRSWTPRRSASCARHWASASSTRPSAACRLPRRPHVSTRVAESSSTAPAIRSATCCTRSPAGRARSWSRRSATLPPTAAGSPTTSPPTPSPRRPRRAARTPRVKGSPYCRTPTRWHPLGYSRRWRRARPRPSRARGPRRCSAHSHVLSAGTRAHSRCGPAHCARAARACGCSRTIARSATTCAPRRRRRASRGGD
mmetsp:Transcript_60614/g.160344  ORF Transcript_60614/g.160344 Transcript_60614/m.160344 type:complete len:218 (-) Transcript_60614:47-700(-)